MTANLKTREVVEAAITLLNAKVGTTISFAPVLIQEGHLMFYVEQLALTNDIPSIWVRAMNLEIEPLDVGGSSWVSLTTLRVVVVGSSDHGDAVIDDRQNVAEEVAQVFIGGAGDGYDLDESISGYTITQAVPVSVEFEPPEHDVVSLVEERQLYAVAVNVLVEGRSSRV